MHLIGKSISLPESIRTVITLRQKLSPKHQLASWCCMITSLTLCTQNINTMVITVTDET